MATSQNGYSAPITPVSRLVPGGSIPVRSGPTGDLLIWVANQFHSQVEPLIFPGCWGYAYRDVRGSTDLSNHASGTAIDLNAPKHPLGTNPAANYTPAQITAIHQIVNQTGGCIRWGGDYTGRKDPMHFEVVKSESECARVLSTLTESVPPPSLGGGTNHDDEEDEDMIYPMRLDVAMSSSGLSLPWDEREAVLHVIADSTVVFVGKPLCWAPTGGVGGGESLIPGVNPSRVEVNQPGKYRVPAGTTRVWFSYSCATRPYVWIKAV